jgi:hypothetical protein
MGAALTSQCSMRFDPLPTALGGPSAATLDGQRTAWPAGGEPALAGLSGGVEGVEVAVGGWLRVAVV